MSTYQLRERYWVGSSIGYYKVRTIETFEDFALAEKERSNLQRRGIGSGVFYISEA